MLFSGVGKKCPMSTSPTAPNTASSQFYIALSDIPQLDGRYAVFGYVTEGMDVVDRISIGDRIVSVTVNDGLDNLSST